MKLPKNLDDILTILHQRCWIDGIVDRQRLESFKTQIEKYKKYGYDVKRYEEYVKLYKKWC